MQIDSVYSFREKLKDFINSENILGTTAGVTIAISAGNMIQSFVKEIIFPSIYYVLKYKFGGEFSPINTTNISRFGKEFTTFTFVLIFTFIFIKYVLVFLFNIRQDETKKKQFNNNNNNNNNNNGKMYHN